MTRTACVRASSRKVSRAARRSRPTRREVIDALSSHLVERFQKVLDDPILEAFSIFDVRKWPADKDVGRHRGQRSAALSGTGRNLQL